MLTDDELAMLEMERQLWTVSGAKEAAIRERFDLSAAVYYFRLDALIDRDEAMEVAPVVVGRLLRLREARRGVRASRRLEHMPGRVT